MTEIHRQEVRKEKVMIRNTRTKEYIISDMPHGKLPKNFEELELIGKCWHCEKFDIDSKSCGWKILKWIHRPGNIEVYPVCE